MDRQYNLRLDLQFRCNNSLMKFRQSDNKTSDFFMRITRSGELFNIDKAIVILAVVKPNQSVQSQFLDIRDNKIYADLNSNMKDKVGTYKAQALLIYQDERVATDIIEYEVTEDNILNQLETTVQTTEEFTMLKDMISRLSTIELQEQSRIDKELSREEAETLREQSIAKMKLDIVKLVEDTNTKISNSLKSNTDKVNTLVADTKKELSDYKTTKDTELEEKFTNYKNETSTNLNNDFNTYKSEKDNAINQDLTNYKSEKNNEIDLYKSNKDAEIDKYVKVKNTELDAYKVAKNKEIDIYKANKDTLIDNKIAEVEATKQSMVSTVNNKVEEMDGKISETDTRLDELKEFDKKMQVVDSNENTRKSNEEARKLAESNRSNEHLAKISESNSKIAEINATKNEVIKKTDEKAQEIEGRFTKLSTQQQQSSELIDARGDSESLKEELERIETKAKEVWQSVEGSYITVLDSIAGSIKNIEILGNTVQGSDLSNIQSAGIVQEDGQVKMSILSCGKNLFNGYATKGRINVATGSNFIIEQGQPGYASSNLIKIHPGRTYRISGAVDWVVLYDIDKKVTRYHRATNGVSPIANESYCGFYSTNDVNTLRDVQLEVGDVITTYEPYQSSKTDILLPCQLEGLESGRDRLYYSEEDKAWCVDTILKDGIANGLETWYVDGRVGDFYRFYSRIVPDSKVFQGTDAKGIISDKLQSSTYTGTEEGIYLSPYGVKLVGVKVSADKATSVSELKTWISNNNINFKYLIEEPEKNILPLDTQIALNSFFGTTNAWVESGEVDGILSGKVSKSLASSLQSAHDDIKKLDDRVKNIEGLQESQNFKYATEKGYQVCEQTKNGQIDKLKISGKTLNNMMSMEGTWTFNSTDIIAYFTPNDKEKISTLIRNYNKVTMIFLNLPSSAVSCMLYNYSGLTKKNSINVFDLDSTLSGNIIPHIYALSSNPFNQDEVKKIKIMIIPGDQLDIAPYLDYFDGLSSVGDGVDTIEVLSCNENLFTKQFISEFETTHKFDSDGNMTLSGKWCSKFDLSHIKGDTIYISYKWEKLTSYTGEPYVAVYDKYANRILPVKDGTYEKYTSTNGFGAINFYISSGNLGECKYSNIMISSKKREYTPRKLHKKQILFKDNDGTWKKPILRGNDTIEQHSDGKWYYHKRDDEGIINENSVLTKNTSVTGFSRFHTNTNLPNKKPDSNLVCDKLVVSNVPYLTNESRECIGGFSNNSFINFMFAGDLSVEQAKTRLQSNPVTVIYQLAQEQIYECTPLTLDSYANETMISFVGGPINPYMEFEVTSYISNLVLGNTKRINYLEDKFIEYVITQNRLTLKSRYNTDSVTFRIDVATMSEAISDSNVDYDLYNLLNDNIRAGKDNYNRVEMEGIIDFYFMNFTIDFEMYNNLIIKIKEQYGEIIDMTPVKPMEVI